MDVHAVQAEVEAVFGPEANIFDDVLVIPWSAKMSEVHTAFFNRRYEFYNALHTNVSLDSSLDKSTLNTTSSSALSMSHTEREEIKKKIDVLIRSFRIVGDPLLRKQYSGIIVTKKETSSLLSNVASNESSAHSRAIEDEFDLIALRHSPDAKSPPSPSARNVYLSSQCQPSIGNNRRRNANGHAYNDSSFESLESSFSSIFDVQDQSHLSYESEKDRDSFDIDYDMLVTKANKSTIRKKEKNIKMVTIDDDDNDDVLNTPRTRSRDEKKYKREKNMTNRDEIPILAKNKIQDKESSFKTKKVPEDYDTVVHDSEESLNESDGISYEIDSYEIKNSRSRYTPTSKKSRQRKDKGEDDEEATYDADETTVVSLETSLQGNSSYSHKTDNYIQDKYSPKPSKQKTADEHHRYLSDTKQSVGSLDDDATKFSYAANSRYVDDSMDGDACRCTAQELVGSVTDTLSAFDQVFNAFSISGKEIDDVADAVHRAEKEIYY